MYEHRVTCSSCHDVHTWQGEDFRGFLLCALVRRDQVRHNSVKWLEEAEATRLRDRWAFQPGSSGHGTRKQIEACGFLVRT